jgi:hypothetical protein
MDAIEGYETTGKTSGDDLADLKKQLANRITPKKGRSILLWRILPIAACIFVMIGVGRVFLTDKPAKVKTSLVVSKQTAQPDNIAINPPLISKKSTEVVPQKLKHQNLVADMVTPQRPTVSANKAIVFKSDTVEYKGSTYVVNENESIDKLLKKMEGMQVDSNGYIAKNGQSNIKIKLNGKEYTRGSVEQALKNLPADIVEKIQVIDDYSDQASKVGAAPRASGGKDTSAPRYIMQKPMSLIISDNPVGNEKYLLMGKTTNTKASRSKMIDITTNFNTVKDVERGSNKFYGSRQNQPLQSRDKSTQYFGRRAPEIIPAMPSNIIAKGPVPDNPIRNIDSLWLGNTTGLAIKNYAANSNNLARGYIKSKAGAVQSAIADNRVATVDPSMQGRNTGLLIQNNSGPAVKNVTHYMVTGKVTNYKDGSPMKGAVISSTPGKELAKADVNGAFKVLIPAGNTITISYPGYISKSAKIDRPYNLIVILAEDKQP